MRFLAWSALLLAGVLSLGMSRGWFGRPHAPDLDRLPVELGPLRQVQVIPVAPASLGEFPPERFHYAVVGDAAGREGNLYVAWFARGRRWSGRPHSTDVCFEAGGWVEEEAHRVFRSDGHGQWSRQFRRGDRTIRVVHWIERPSRTGSEHWFPRALRFLGRREGGLRQDVASIYFEFPAEASPSDAELLAASEALVAALDALWDD